MSSTKYSILHDLFRYFIEFNYESLSQYNNFQAESDENPSLFSFYSKVNLNNIIQKLKESDIDSLSI